MSFNPEEELKEFPCSFTLVPGSKVTNERYKHLQNGLRGDLLNMDDCLNEETIRNKNLLAWVKFCLDEKEESFKLSQEILKDTKRKNITALGNFVYISFRLGYKIKSEKYMKALRALKKQENFEALVTEALAEQAYAYSRLGGLKNPKQAKELYKLCIDKCPKNYLWKYGLGLVCRRLTKVDLSISSDDNTDMTELTIECVKLLFEVAEHADDYLKGLAYSQLVRIRQYNPSPQHDVLFKGYTVIHLCNKALRYGRNNPVVLTQCGRSLKSLNVDDAIDLLKESLTLKEDNTAYSHLGLCYQRKAGMIADGQYHPKESLLNTKSAHSESFGFDTTKPRKPQNESLTYGQVQNESRFQNETRGRGRFQNKSSSHPTFLNTSSLSHLQRFIYNEDRILAKDDTLVREAISCFENAKKISHGENVSAIMCLGKIYFNTEQFEDALAQFNQVIDRINDTALVSLIDAYERAGKCLKALSKHSDNREKLEGEAKEYFAKAISLAGDLVAKNQNYKDFDKLISGSICIFSEDTAPERNQEIDNCQEDSGTSSIANEDRNIAAQEPDNIHLVLKKLKGYLESGYFEKALAYLCLKNSTSYFANKTAASEIRDLLSKIYFEATWSRLKKLSPDCKRTFQKMFELKYGHCEGMVNEMEEEGDMNKHDVLIINDSETDHETCASNRLSLNMLYVFEMFFGLKTFHHLEINLASDHGHGSEELNVQCLLMFSLVVIILEEPISENYRRLLDTLNQLNGPKVLVINCGRIHECPDSLKGSTFVDLTTSSGPLTKLAMTTTTGAEFDSSQYEQGKAFLNHILGKLFDGNPEAVMRLFCLLVGEDFDQLAQHCQINAKNEATPA